MAEFLQMNKDDRANKKRDLTPKTMTRWYRAPEVCFTQQYNKAIDIWSLGVILSELIYCSTPYLSPNFDSSNRYLFNGKSSYPLSPSAQLSKSQISNNDQLVKIMQIFPNLIPSVDFCFLHDNSRSLAKRFFEQSKKNSKSLSERFPLTKQVILNILEEMLQINPYMRPTAKQLLKNKMFDNVRMTQLE